MNKYKYIIPVFSTNNVDGCGFFIDNFFITAGHIISMAENPFILLSGKKVYLEKPLYFEVNKDYTGHDLAIFSIPSVKSDLRLFQEEIKPGTTLVSISFKEGMCGTVLCECNATVYDFNIGNYFGAITDMNLKEGSSGSPVLIGNEVAGILIYGNNNGFNFPCDKNFPVNFCCFLSSKSIQEVI